MESSEKKWSTDKKTVRQWMKEESRVPVDGAEGIEYKMACSNKAIIYYERIYTREATEAEITAFREAERAKRQEQKRKRELRKWKSKIQWLQDGCVPLEGADWKKPKYIGMDPKLLPEGTLVCHERDVYKDAALAAVMLKAITGKDEEE